MRVLSYHSPQLLVYRASAERQVGLDTRRAAVAQASHDPAQIQKQVVQAGIGGSAEDERRRLRRDLHDGVGPLLATQLLILDTHRVTGRPELLVHLEEQARAAVGEVRRVAHDLRPAVLDAGGLAAGLAAEAERVGVAGLPVELVVDLGGAEPSAAAEVALLRIAQEALPTWSTGRGDGGARTGHRRRARARAGRRGRRPRPRERRRRDRHGVDARTRRRDRRRRPHRSAPDGHGTVVRVRVPR